MTDGEGMDIRRGSLSGAAGVILLVAGIVAIVLFSSYHLPEHKRKTAAGPSFKTKVRVVKSRPNLKDLGELKEERSELYDVVVENCNWNFTRPYLETGKIVTSYDGDNYYQDYPQSGVHRDQEYQRRVAMYVADRPLFGRSLGILWIAMASSCAMSDDALSELRPVYLMFEEQSPKADVSVELLSGESTKLPRRIEFRESGPPSAPIKYGAVYSVGAVTNWHGNELPLEFTLERVKITDGSKTNILSRYSGTVIGSYERLNEKVDFTPVIKNGERVKFRDNRFYKTNRWSSGMNLDYVASDIITVEEAKKTAEYVELIGAPK